MATNKPQFTPKQIVTALVASGGSRVVAAEALGITTKCICKYIRLARQAGLIVPKAPHHVPKLKPEVDPRTSARIKVLEKALKEARKESADATALKEVLGTAKSKLDVLQPPAWLAAKSAKASSPGVPTLFLSDLHWGEVVFSGQIGGVNEYNLDIAHKRMRYTVDTAIHLLKILDAGLNYPGIVVPLGGDMISGDIHEELATTNALPTMPTVFDLFEHLVGALSLLADTFGAVFTPCVGGNHGRNTKKVWAKNRNHTSFDWMLYQMLAHHFRDDKRITFFIPDGSDALYRVYGTRYLLTHGDQFRGGDSIIGPLGPLTRGNQKKLARNTAVDMSYDLMICGHWHQYIHLERLIVNGSMKGYDEYAYTSNFGFEPPRQGLWMTHPRNGITFRMPILCERSREKADAPWVSVR